MKKKIFLISFFFALFFLFKSPLLAAEKVDSFDLQAIVNLDGTVDFIETINYDFGYTEKHGIYREIPLNKTNDTGEKFLLEIELNSITDSSGNFLNYYDESTRDTAIFKIGDSDVYVTGKNTYVLDYTVSGALTYFEDHDELYWNVNGTDWDVSFTSVSATVSLPSEISLNDVYLKCYTGSYGSSSSDCTAKKQQNALVFQTDNTLYSGENLSFVIGFPTGVVTKLEPRPDNSDKFDTLFSILAVLGTIAFYFLLPLLLFIIYLKKGKDPKVAKGPTAWFDVPKKENRQEMTPAEIGLLIDEKIDPRDVSATILSLAIKGYLTIEKTGKKKTDYKFVKKEDKDQGLLTEFDRSIYEALFKGGQSEVTVKDLEKKFFEPVKKAKDKLYETMTDEKFFEKNPDKVRQTYQLLASLSIFFGNIFLLIILLIMAKAMPKRTFMGAEKKEEALSLKRFLSSQDRQLEFQEKNWYFFEKLLPYAIAFGVAKVWAEKFADLQVPSDVSWYHDSLGSNLMAIAFVNNLTHFTRAAETLSGVPYSSSRSSSGFHSGFSGGGFSGGGGGGGGGGSW